MKHFKHQLFSFFTLVTLAACTQASPTPTSSATIQQSDTGILTDSQGMTLYRFAKDQPQESHCYGKCAENWPPVLVPKHGVATLASSLPGKLGTAVRKDGPSQVTYNGMPLYGWIKDKQPGDTTGNGVKGVWFTVPLEPQPTVSVRQDERLGTLLVDSQGRTLYRFTQDSGNTSACYGKCAQNWPPLLVDSESDLHLTSNTPGTLGLTQRKDGTQQVTYNNQPLYGWIKDKHIGETTGHGVKNVWFVVNVAK